MKNLRAIILLFVANTISGMAQGISMLAIPWYFAKEGILDMFGLVFILTNAVSFVWVPYAGVLTDRYNRKRIFQVLFILGGLVIGGLALTGHLNEGLPWWAVAMAFMYTFFNYNIHYPNLYAFVQEITESRYYGRVTSAMEIQHQFTTMFAGAGAAILLEGTLNGQLNIFGIHFDVPFDISAWTIYEIFTLDAATYLGAFIVISLIRFVPVVQRSAEIGSIARRLRTGLRYLLTHKYVTIFGVASYCVFVVILIEGFFLGPLYVSKHLLASGDVYAASEMYYAVGAVSAGFLILKAFRSDMGLRGIVFLTIACSATCVMLALTRSDAVFYFALLMFGLTNSGTRILRVNYLFRIIPNEVFGRTNSIFGMTNILLRIVFLSLFALPFFHEENNVIYALVILAVFLMCAAIILVSFYRKFASQQQSETA